MPRNTSNIPASRRFSPMWTNFIRVMSTTIRWIPVLPVGYDRVADRAFCILAWCKAEDGEGDHEIKNFSHARTLYYIFLCKNTKIKEDRREISWKSFSKCQKTCAFIFLMYINSVTFCKLRPVKIAFCKVGLRATCEILGRKIANCKIVCVLKRKV